MASLTLSPGNNITKPAVDQSIRWPSILLVLALAADLFTPFLIWKGILPAIIRWVSDAAIVLMIALVPLRMLAYKKMPVTFWLILFLSLVGILTSLLSGQGFPATIWGWWLMFQFPLVGLFSYLQPEWPKDFYRGFLITCLAIVALEVFVQIGQYFTGEIPGDNLAGTFGKNGTGDLVLFLILVLCFSLGDWLHSQRWVFIVTTLILGVISSIFGEMKLFYLAITLLGLMGLYTFILRGKQVWKLIPITFILAFSLIVFVPLYNTIIPYANQLPLESYVKNPALLTKYLTFVNRSTAGTNYYYDIGRNYAVVYGWDKISQNPQYLYLGYGLGARGESRSLGIIGRGLQEGDLGITSGTSLLVILQETGLVGMVVLGVFFLIVISGLIKQIRHRPDASSNGLRFGLIFFTILWPVWLWYNAAWSLRVPMLIYWSMLGYVFSEFEFGTRLEKLASIRSTHQSNPHFDRKGD